MRYNFLRFPDGKTKALTLSYDDGCRQENINAGYVSGKSAN